MSVFTPFILLGLLVFIPIGIPTLIVCVVDILWAGPAAFISAREAKKYGYDPSAYAKKGALYSLLSFALWRSLMKVMHGEAFDAGDVKTGYIILFVCWFVTVPFFSSLVTLFTFSQDAPEVGWFVCAWAIASFAVWFVSIRKLREFHRGRALATVQDTSDETTKVKGEVSILRGYIMPIFLAKLSLLIMFTALAIFVVLALILG